MKYYVYFDDYRRPRKAVSEKELSERYGNDPAEFRKAWPEWDRMQLPSMS